MSLQGRQVSVKHRERPMLNRTELTAFLATQLDIIAAYLFGSLAEGRSASASDVDIAILLREASDRILVGQRQLALMGDLERFANRQVDLIILNTAPPLLQHQVLRHGQLLYERDKKARVEFEVRSGQIYADLQPMYDFHGRDVLKKIREVGLGRRRRRHYQSAETPS